MSNTVLPSFSCVFFLWLCGAFVILVLVVLLMSGLSCAASMAVIPFLRSLLRRMFFLPTRIICPCPVFTCFVLVCLLFLGFL